MSLLKKIFDKCLNLCQTSDWNVLLQKSECIIPSFAEIRHKKIIHPKLSIFFGHLYRMQKFHGQCGMKKRVQIQEWFYIRSRYEKALNILVIVEGQRKKNAAASKHDFCIETRFLFIGRYTRLLGPSGSRVPLVTTKHTTDSIPQTRFSISLHP